jgi:predicted PurR-regulated permease PerM
MSEQTLDISWETIIKVFIAGFTLYILYLVRDIVVWFFFALIISLLVEPAIKFLRWFKIPKILAVILIYLSIFAIVGFVIYLTAPIFIFELKQFSQNIPEYFEKINPLLKGLGLEATQSFEDFTRNLVATLEESSISIFRAAAAFFGGIYSTIFIFTLAFFISLEESGAERVLVLLTPKRYEEYIIALFEKAQTKVSGWFGARILACLFVGVASFIVFYLLGIKYSFFLSLISGVLNFVPYVGPGGALILIAVTTAVSTSWLAVIYVVAAFLLIQLIENNFLSPFLMKKFIDLPPVLVLMSLLVGGTIFGFLGTIFAVPVFGIVYEFLKEFLEKKREEETQLF